MLKKIITLFVVTLVGYLVIFYWLEHHRVVKGPWTVDFATDESGPSLVVSQESLGIANVRLRFAKSAIAPHAPTRIRFAEAKAVPFEVPFGQCVFLDTTFLPGTIVLNINGHEIQFIPRVLTIDKVERPWRNGEQIDVE